MRVIHILKDGSRPTDITGHIVKLEDVEILPKIVHIVSKKKSNTYERNNEVRT